MMIAPAAQAHNGHDWDAVAACESGGNWSADTGNGYFGGLQIARSTWGAAGGTGSPAQASRDEQIRIAETVLATHGRGAWPVCGAYL
ncbi:transglycosylase family protein [Nocardia miyunensis]|uniref:transglycosylase family protein n=1 Tax=Nocardia miyunensis TaxID=282684 RepID=UPI000A0193BE|nr:transglycosylase family protein [Nocardia miyunensis]